MRMSTASFVFPGPVFAGGTRSYTGGGKTMSDKKSCVRQTAYRIDGVVLTVERHHADEPSAAERIYRLLAERIRRGPDGGPNAEETNG